MNMKIIFSGVQNDRWRAAVSEEQRRGRVIAWLEAKELLAPANEGKVPSDVQIVWLFCSPVDAVMAVEGESSAGVGAALASWLAESRAALNLKQQLGGRLSFADGNRLAVCTICDLLEPGARHAPETVVEGGGGTHVQAALLQLLGRCDARFIEVYELLNAASQFGGDMAPTVVDSIPSWSQVIGVINAMRLADQGALCRSILESNLRESQALAIKQEQEHQELFKRKEEEGEALLSQLHLAQEELQQYALRLTEAEQERASQLRKVQKVQEELERNLSYLRGVKHEKAEGDRLLEEARQQVSSLRLQLEGAAGELQHLASCEPDLSRIATRGLSSTLGRRLVKKLLPGSVWRHRAGIAARRELDRTLVQIRNSGWFDPDWYLRSYRDVKETGIDPVEHYHMHGWKEGRNPGPGFNSAYYLDSNPDVRRIGIDPLLHFIRHGASEGRKPVSTPG